MWKKYIRRGKVDGESSFLFFHHQHHQLHSHSSFTQTKSFRHIPRNQSIKLSQPSNSHLLTSQPQQSPHHPPHPPHQTHPQQPQQCPASTSPASPSPTPTPQPLPAPHPAPPRSRQSLPAAAPQRTTGPPQAPTSASSPWSPRLLRLAQGVLRLPSRRERRRA